jgi:hypothetical protein
MSALERITGSDWAAWAIHMLRAMIAGVATSVEASICAGAASTASNAAWEASGNSLELMAWAALAGWVLSTARYLKANPLPTGNEVEGD